MGLHLCSDAPKRANIDVFALFSETNFVKKNEFLFIVFLQEKRFLPFFVALF